MNLKSSASRLRLKPYREPYWEKFPTALLKGASLGYRRSPESEARTWHVRVYVDGKYHTCNLGPERPDYQYKEAYRAALEWAQAVKYAGPVAKVKSTLQDVLDEYLTKLQGNSSERNLQRRKQAEKRINALLSDQIKKRQINSITAREINNVQRIYQQRKNRKGAPISPESVNRVMTHLIAALNHGYRSGMIDSDAAWKHYQRLPEEPHKRKVQKYVSKKDRECFINACPEHLKAFVSAMEYFGARPSEICRLRVSDVDLGIDSVRLMTYKGKARTRDFPLPMDAPVRQLFENQVKDKETTDFVFTTSSNKPWTQANLAKAHKVVREQIGLPDSFNTYSWRHCRITDLVDNGAPAPAIATLTGTSLEYIQKNYYKSDTNLLTQIVIS